MRPHTPLVVVSGAAFVLLCPVLTAAAPASAAPTPGGAARSYSWVGSTVDHRGDGHSWTDRRNWSPTGVPGDADAVNIVSPQSGPCNVHVDAVPTGITLSNLLLSTSITPGCRASISGGSLSIHGTFLWTGGTVDTPITISDGSGVQIGDEPVHVVERLLQPLVFTGGSLQLSQAHMRFVGAGRLSLAAASSLRVTFPSEITGVPRGGALPSLVNRATMQLSGSTLRLDSIAFDQRGEVDLDAESSIVTTHGSLRSRDGARYVGPGRLLMSNGSEVVLDQSQTLADDVHLELGNDSSEGATLDGVATLSGDGSLDWTGGTIGAFLTLEHGVTLHAFGGRHSGPGSRVLSGEDTRHASPQHDIVIHGTAVMDGGARVTMTKHALLTIAPDGSLTLAPGTVVHGRGDGQGDAIRAGEATVSVPADRGGAGAVVLDNVAYMPEGGQTEVAPGSELRLTGGVRGNLAQASLTGGGTFSVAEPMEVVSQFSLGDGSVMRLLPGGSLDGTAVYTGDGSFEWLGGELSGNDVGFALNDLTVGGATTKSIADDHGFTSFVQTVGPVTFTSGTSAHPSLLDMGGNSFQSFLACTVDKNVELRDGDFVSSVGALVFNPGAHGSVIADSDAQIFSSGPLTFFSGTVEASGSVMVNGGDVAIRDGASLQLPEPSHPLRLNDGSLTGEGSLDGDLVQSGGVFEPGQIGADHPMSVTGSYTQADGGRLVLDLSPTSGPMGFGGAVSIAGTVTYANAVGYSPMFGDERELLGAEGTFSWAPSCEETTGSRSAHGHWQGSADQRTLLATFEKGTGGSCSG